MDGLIGAIISSGKATLHELKSIYSLEDAIDMWEIIVTVRHNEYLAMKHAEKQSKKQR